MTFQFPWLFLNYPLLFKYSILIYRLRSDGLVTCFNSFSPRKFEKLDIWNCNKSTKSDLISRSNSITIFDIRLDFAIFRCRNWGWYWKGNWYEKGVRSKKEFEFKIEFFIKIEFDIKKYFDIEKEQYWHGICYHNQIQYRKGTWYRKGIWYQKGIRCLKEIDVEIEFDFGIELDDRTEFNFENEFDIENKRITNLIEMNNSNGL